MDALKAPCAACPLELHHKRMSSRPKTAFLPQQGKDPLDFVVTCFYAVAILNAC
jgi:hypothetical protein